MRDHGCGEQMRFSMDGLFASAVRRVAEQRIREAMARGVFDNLKGQGEPLPDESYDELWWVRRWLKREQLNSGRAQHELRDALRAMRK